MSIFHILIILIVREIIKYYFIVQFNVVPNYTTKFNCEFQTECQLIAPHWLHDKFRNIGHEEVYVGKGALLPCLEQNV